MLPPPAAAGQSAETSPAAAAATARTSRALLDRPSDGAAAAPPPRPPTRRERATTNLGFSVRLALPRCSCRRRRRSTKEARRRFLWLFLPLRRRRSLPSVLLLCTYLLSLPLPQPLSHILCSDENRRVNCGCKLLSVAGHSSIMFRFRLRNEPNVWTDGRANGRTDGRTPKMKVKMDEHRGCLLARLRSPACLRYTL